MFAFFSQDNFFCGVYVSGSGGNTFVIVPKIKKKSWKKRQKQGGAKIVT